MVTFPFMVVDAVADLPICVDCVLGSKKKEHDDVPVVLPMQTTSVAFRE